MAEDELIFTTSYSKITIIQVAIEDITDREFVEKWASKELWSTPLYYQDALRNWPERHGAGVSAIARARPGGVLFHCVRGNDRTGIISLLLLALAGVTPDEIVADYELSADPARDELLASRNSSSQEVILGVLDGFDIENYLRAGGVSRDDMVAVRQRLLS